MSLDLTFNPAKRKNPNTLAHNYGTYEDCLCEASGQSDMGNKEHQHNQETTVRQPKPKKPTRKQTLLSNPDVKSWHDNVARGSMLTAYQRLYRLDRFCTEHQMTPIGFRDLALKDLRAATNMLMDHITSMEERGSAPGYIQSTISALKSWLESADIKIVRKLRVSNLNDTPTLQNERVPESAEVAEMFSRADLRVGAIESLISKAGLRPLVLGNNNAMDGLTMSDLPDIAIIQGSAQCIRNPARIIVRKRLSNAKHEYFTFLTSSGTQRLIAYLNDRIAKGDSLGAGSPVIAPDTDHAYGRHGNNGKPFLATHRITELVRESLRPRFGWRPYVLRAYFDTQLLIAESKGRIARDFRVFFMGHKGSIEARYTTNKGVLPESLMQEMRESFLRCEEFLDLEMRHEDKVEKQKAQLHDTIAQATPERVQEMLRLLGVGKSQDRG